MSAPIRTIILTIVLAFAAGLGGAWLGVQLFSPTHQASLHQLVHGEMTLSPAQQAQMDKAEAAHKVRKAELDARLAAANHHLADVMRGTPTYSPQVDAAIDDVHLALGDLQKETIKYVYEMRAILTSKQAKRLDDRVFDTLTKDDR